MYLSVGGALHSRFVSKALFRISPIIKRLENNIEEIQLDQYQFNGLMLSFAPEPASYIQEVKNFDDIFQVEVGYDMETPRDQLETMLLKTIAMRVVDIIHMCPIGDNDKEKLYQVVTEWRTAHLIE